MWIARDKDKSLWLFYEKPTKEKYVWLSNFGIGTQIRINEKLFPEVKWEDKEPKLLIVK